MIHAFLITKGTEEQRGKKAKDIVKNYETARSGIMEVTPETGGGAIGIDQIRKIKTRLGLRAAKNKLKICWIKKAHLLTTEAQNAILKTLEEPPQQAIIILSTSKPNQLLPTIQSRCRIINLKSAIDIRLGSKKHQNAVSDLQLLLNSSKGARLEWSYNIKGMDRDLVNNMLTYWLTAARDGLISKYIPEKIINKEINSKQGSPINKIGEKHLLQMIKNTKEAQKKLTQTNVNQQILLDNLVLNFP